MFVIQLEPDFPIENNAVESISMRCLCIRCIGLRTLDQTRQFVHGHTVGRLREVETRVLP